MVTILLSHSCCLWRLSPTILTLNHLLSTGQKYLDAVILWSLSFVEEVQLWSGSSCGFLGVWLFFFSVSVSPWFDNCQNMTKLDTLLKRKIATIFE